MTENERKQQFANAMSLLHEGCAVEALKACKVMESSGSELDQLSGYLCSGFVHEDGGADLRPDYEMAMSSFRRASIIQPSAIVFCCMARIAMKSGKEWGRRVAIGYLHEAARFGSTPEVSLGFAHYYRTGDKKELGKAKEYYLKAALRGRLAGFKGYSEVAMDMGHTAQAFAVIVAKIIIGPLLVLVLGRRAQESFL